MTIIDKLKSPKGLKILIGACLFFGLHQCTTKCNVERKHKKEITNVKHENDSIILVKDAEINNLESLLKSKDSVINSLDKEKSVLDARLNVTNKQNEQLININKKATNITISTEKTK